MDKNYRLIMLKMDYITEQIYELATLAESTSFFPVRSYVNLREDLEEFYLDLKGASKKTADFNIEEAKKRLNSAFGLYTDTDSIKRRVDSDGHQD